jgi:DNA-binding response OmpR family regulator
MMTAEISLIEAALETEKRMMERQRLLKQLWKLNQSVENVAQDPRIPPRESDIATQSNCNAA